MLRRFYFIFLLFLLGPLQSEEGANGATYSSLLKPTSPEEMPKNESDASEEDASLDEEKGIELFIDPPEDEKEQYVVDEKGNIRKRDVLDDFMSIHKEKQVIEKRPPISMGYYAVPGYINMPSARMLGSGSFGVAATSVSPFSVYSLVVQPYPRIQLSGSYRIYRGYPDPKLNNYGYGNFTERGGNFKISPFLPEDSGYKWPGVAIGADDVFGTQKFYGYYIVATQVLPDYNTEMSLGVGGKHYKGIFGGITVWPLLYTRKDPIRNVGLTLEHDSLDYKNSPHPNQMMPKTRWNVGVKWRILNYINLMGSYDMGQNFDCSVAAVYNFGESKGLLPKVEDPLPYTAPRNQEPLGINRPSVALGQDLAAAFDAQGFRLQGVWLEEKEGLKTLRLLLVNKIYRFERVFRARIEYLLAELVPNNIDRVIVVIENDAVDCQEYEYEVKDLAKLGDDKLGESELEMKSYYGDVRSFKPSQWQEIYQSRRPTYDISVSPKVNSNFNSPQSKFQYALGLTAGIDGFLPTDIYYHADVLYIFQTTISPNPVTQTGSNFARIFSDYNLYYSNRSFTLETGYLQYGKNLGTANFARIAGGYFNRVFGGGALEMLYYPLESAWAFGVEGAVVKKRRYEGLGFQNELKYVNADGTFSYQHYTLLYQAFLDFYYDFTQFSTKIKLSAGRFLAGDVGVRTEITRYFPSGAQICYWLSITSGEEYVNGRRYYDTGISFIIPFDLLFTHSDKAEWDMSISPWTRDVGRWTSTGETLYKITSAERR